MHMGIITSVIFNVSCFFMHSITVTCNCFVLQEHGKELLQISSKMFKSRHNLIPVNFLCMRWCQNSSEKLSQPRFILQTGRNKLSASYHCQPYYLSRDSFLNQLHHFWNTVTRFASSNPYCYSHI